jgi:GTPase SAR1 family protein
MLPSSSSHPPAPFIETIRIAVIGDSGVGKSTFIRKLCYTTPESTNFFDFGANIDVCYHIHDPEQYFDHIQQEMDTIETELGLDQGIEGDFIDANGFHSQHTNMTIPENITPIYPADATMYIIEFIDMPGHKRYQETRESLFKNIDGVLLFFDARNSRSISSVPKWFAELTLLQHQHNVFNVFYQPCMEGKYGKRLTRDKFSKFLDGKRTHLGSHLDHTFDDNIDGDEESRRVMSYSGHCIDSNGDVELNTQHGNKNRVNKAQNIYPPHSNNIDTSFLTPNEGIFPLLLIGSVVNNLDPNFFPWYPTLPYTDLAFFDVNKIADFVMAPKLNKLSQSTKLATQSTKTAKTATKSEQNIDDNSDTINHLDENNVDNTHPFVIFEKLIGKFVDEIIIAKKTNQIRKNLEKEIKLFFKNYRNNNHQNIQQMQNIPENYPYTRPHINPSQPPLHNYHPYPNMTSEIMTANLATNMYIPSMAIPTPNNAMNGAQEQHGGQFLPLLTTPHPYQQQQQQQQLQQRQFRNGGKDDFLDNYELL